ncbi:MAG TPA: alpha/beta family hydrolase [Candidatus Limnocylindrales bacterium]|nr:alpha/beta family hydrolase [Candidatus Limnocylindrales bacterium]
MTATTRVVLAHGASGTSAQMQPHVAGLRERGFDAQAIDLPKRRAEDAVPAYVAALAALPPPPAGDPAARPVIGGHSYGGRVASLLAATDPGACRGLLLFSYPLHRPGGAETWPARSSHFGRIGCPVLLLSGEADPFARIDLLREAVGLLAEGRLISWPRLGHGLGPVLDEALDAAAEWLRELG